jgi:hypothetical protein
VGNSKMGSGYKAITNRNEGNAKSRHFPEKSLVKSLQDLEK